MLAACRLERTRRGENKGSEEEQLEREDEKDFFEVSRTLAYDFPGTHGDLLVALLTTLFLTGEYRAAASLSVVAGGLSYLAASMYQLDCPSYCSAVPTHRLCVMP